MLLSKTNLVTDRSKEKFSLENTQVFKDMTGIHTIN